MSLFINGCSCSTLLSVCGFTFAGTEGAFLPCLFCLFLSFPSLPVFYLFFLAHPFFPNLCSWRWTWCPFRRKAHFLSFLACFSCSVEDLEAHFSVAQQNIFFSRNKLNFTRSTTKWFFQCHIAVQLNVTYGMLNYYMVALISVDSFSELIHSSFSYHYL